MTARGSQQSIGAGVRSGTNGISPAITFQIVGELFDRRVSPARFLGHGLGQYPLQISSQLSRVLRGLSRNQAGALRFGGEHGLHQLADPIGAQRVRSAARQHDVGEHAQRIHVGHRCQGSALELFRTRIGRCRWSITRHRTRRIKLSGDAEVK
jgi:hypothetical protein